MRLSCASSYALQALNCLARHGGPLSARMIAWEHLLPVRFLLKVLRPLVAAGVLKSVRGPGGGYRLSRSPSNISVLEIVEAIDGPIRGVAPGLIYHWEWMKTHNPARSAQATKALDRKLERLCQAVAENVRASLDRVKLSDLS